MFFEEMFNTQSFLHHEHLIPATFWYPEISHNLLENVLKEKSTGFSNSPGFSAT